MKYLDEINSFYTLLETNSLSTPSIALWHALMHICNRTGWKREFNAANAVLELKTGLSKPAVRRARNALKQAGLIDFVPRKGQQSTTYILISIADRAIAERSVPQSVPQSDAQTVPQTVPQSVHSPIAEHSVPQSVPQTVPQTDAQAVTIPRLDKDKDKTKPLQHVVRDAEGLKSVVNFFQNNYHPVASPYEQDRLVGLVTDYGADHVIRALQISIENSAKSLKYVEAVLRNAQERGWEWEQGRVREKEAEACSDGAARYLAKRKARQEGKPAVLVEKEAEQNGSRSVGLHERAAVVSVSECKTRQSGGLEKVLGDL